MRTETETATATANHLILHPTHQSDPRASLGETALVEASRNYFPVVARGSRRSDSAGLITGGAVALLLGGLTFWSMSGHRVQPATQGMVAPTPVPVAPLPLPVAPRSSVPSVPISSAPIITPQLNVAPGHSQVVIFDSGAAASPPIIAPAGPLPLAGITQKSTASGGNDNDQFARRVGDGDVEVASAEQLSNPSTTITQGTLIRAVLETAINTDLPGYVRAVVSSDVRSFDGSQILVPRYSRLIGQYKSGLAAGQTRVYVIWTRLIRPDGVSVQLGSPGVDFSGNSGVAGKVDGHFLKRFGAAALLTVIGGVSAIGNASVVLQGGGQSAAAIAAQGTTQIPPTIRVFQGEPIRVFTAKDLDFSTVGSSATTSDASNQ